MSSTNQISPPVRCSATSAKPTATAARNQGKMPLILTARERLDAGKEKGRLGALPILGDRARLPSPQPPQSLSNCSTLMGMVAGMRERARTPRVRRSPLDRPIYVFFLLLSFPRACFECPALLLKVSNSNSALPRISSLFCIYDEHPPTYSTRFACRCSVPRVLPPSVVVLPFCTVLEVCCVIAD